MSPITDRLAVCSWSLHPDSPQELHQRLQATGIRRVQLALDPLRLAPDKWGHTQPFFREKGIAIVSGMFGCVGEDYSTLESIRVTGGLAPDSTWEQNWRNLRATAALAHELGLKFVTFHAGFVPHLESDPNYRKMLERLQEAAEIFRAADITLGLETGQETAEDLRALLEKLKSKNVGVNFDPANMLLYDKGDPVTALRVLGPWLRQVHIKDARRTKVAGTWGEEVPAGSGEVDWRRFFSTLKELGFSGDFVIEREAGEQRIADIRTAREMVERTAR
jgi:L-ribulose-5-phosphate 3-epimerase